MKNQLWNGIAFTIVLSPLPPLSNQRTFNWKRNSFLAILVRSQPIRITNAIVTNLKSKNHQYGYNRHTHTHTRQYNFPRAYLTYVHIKFTFGIRKTNWLFSTEIEVLRARVYPMVCVCVRIIAFPFHFNYTTGSIFTHFNIFDNENNRMSVQMLSVVYDWQSSTVGVCEQFYNWKILLYITWWVTISAIAVALVASRKIWANAPSHALVYWALSIVILPLSSFEV